MAAIAARDGAREAPGARTTMAALTCVEMALVWADRLTATERAMVNTVRGRPQARTRGGVS
jgi:hypothetical protein